MANKKPMPVIKAGRFRDMNGDQVIYTAEDLERVADNYDPDQRAPLFLEAGFHSSENGDAAGWVRELFVEGEILWALTGDTPPGVKQAVQEGRRRNVSAEITHDSEGVAQGLKRVGLLGASVPAVTGLPELEVAMFADGQKTVRLVTNFEEEEMGMFKKDKDPDKGKEKAPEAAPESQTPEAPEPQPEPKPETTTSLTEGGDDKTVKLSEQVAKLQKQNAALEAKMKAKEIKAFTEGLSKEGKLPPGLRTEELHSFMASLSDGGEGKTFKFTDGEGKEQESPQLDFFKGFLSGLPVLVSSEHLFTADLAGAEDGEHPEDKAGDAIAQAGGN